MENQITTINDLPNDVIKIILRRVVVSFNSEQYFFINKRFNTICSNMAQMYEYNKNFYCFICRDASYHPPYLKQKGYQMRILFDNICNLCLRSALTVKCMCCNIIFMTSNVWYSNVCINCVEKSKMRLTVVQNYTPLLDQSYVMCTYCNCKLSPRYPSFFVYKIICQKCCDNKIDYKLIVLPTGFPYEINTYCPKKLKL